MNEKIINVFFGVDCLPYKDAERQVHYPILGGAFLGASNTTKIRFYFDYIGDSNTTWVSVAKLPNGKQGSQVLSKSSDSDGNYAELELNSWYTQAKGDVYIALQGYQGGVEYSYDSSTELYEIHGTPTIQTTGSIKLAINYAPIGDSPDYNDEFTTYQDILAALGDKANYENCVLIVDYSDYVNIQALYDYIGFRPFVIELYDEKTIAYFILDNGEYYLRFQNTQGLFESSVLTMSASFDSFTIRPIAPTDNVIRLTSSSGTLSQATLDLAKQDNAYILYDSVYYRKRIDAGDELIFDNFVPSQTSSIITLSLKSFYVDDEGNYSLFTTQLQTYTKTEIETLLATKQNTLVNQVNIKSINNQSLLGTGNIDIQAGGGAWGEITGDIQDQTDLQNEFQSVRAEIAGKAQNISISYSQTAPATDANARLFKKFDNTSFTDLADFNSYVSGLTLANSSFYSTTSFVDIDQSKYIIDLGKKVIKASDIRDYYSAGNSNLFIVEQTYSNGDPLPDRWYSQLIVLDSSNFMLIFNALESKVDVSGLATTGDLSMAVYGIEREIAPAYASQNTYAVGEVVIYNNKLYRCTTAITTAEAWNSEHWEQVSVASDFVNLTGTQVISGEKTIVGSKKLALKYSDSSTTAQTFYFSADSNFIHSLYRGADVVYTFSSGAAFKFNTPIAPTSNGGHDLGTPTLYWKNGYFTGQVYAQNTFNVINASEMTDSTHFTADQLSVMLNGKPTLINGTLLNRSQVCVLGLTLDAYGYYQGLALCRGNTNYPTEICYIKIDNNNALTLNVIIDLQTSGYKLRSNINQLRNVEYFNQKQVPTYAADANWKGEWYGTQAQYDAIVSGGTVDANTTYNIIEE